VNEGRFTFDRTSCKLKCNPWGRFTELLQQHLMVASFLSFDYLHAMVLVLRIIGMHTYRVKRYSSHTAAERDDYLSVGSREPETLHFGSKPQFQMQAEAEASNN
jgi:hypothetical protein